MTDTVEKLITFGEVDFLTLKNKIAIKREQHNSYECEKMSTFFAVTELIVPAI